jgi:FkbM family methyltransferase
MYKVWTDTYETYINNIFVEQNTMKIDCVLTAVNENVMYLDFIPFFIKCWKILYPEIDVKIILIANTFPTNLLPYKDNIILFVPEKNISTSFISQYIRLLYPAILSNYKNGIMITDIDIVPANRHYFTKNIENIGNDKFISMRNVLIDEKQLAICYNVATSKTWSNIFGINKIEDIYTRLRERFNQITYKDGYGNMGWNTDQLDLYSYVIDWNSKTNKLKILDDKNTKFKRLDRATFRLGDTFIFEQITNGVYSDYHCHRPYKENKKINEQFYNSLQKENYFSDITKTDLKTHKKVDTIYFKHDDVNLRVFDTMKDKFSSRVNQEQKFRNITRLMIKNNIIDKNKNIIDLGAWIGDNSLIWSQMIEGKVYAIDPSEHNINIIETLKPLNNISNVITIQKPISNKIEFVEIETGDINHGSFESSNKGIQTETLDNLYTQDIIKNIGFMHIDVEGFEYKVIEGSQNIILKFRPIIATEYHTGDRDVEPLISKHGYKKYIIGEICGGPSCRNIYWIPNEINLPNDILNLF